MEKIQVIGKAWLKTEYMIYIAKALRDVKGGKVLLISDNSFFEEEMKKYEISPNVDVFTVAPFDDLNSAISQFEYDNYNYILLDFTKRNDDILCEKTIIVTDTYKHHLKHNILESTEEDLLIVLDLLSDSKITARYLQKNFEKKVKGIILFYLDIHDRAVLIDNSYNETYKMHKFSKVFKTSFKQLLDELVEVEEKEMKKKLRLVWRKA